MHSPLELTLVLLAAAVIGVVLFRMLQLPPMLAYLVVGVLIGPKATGLESYSAQTRYLAEFGVVFLMFSIGLEFSLTKLRAMRRAMLDRSEQDLQSEARRILVAAMQRLASKPNNDLMVTLVPLPNEDMKRRIVGREGRNIKTF